MYLYIGGTPAKYYDKIFIIIYQKITWKFKTKERSTHEKTKNNAKITILIFKLICLRNWSVVTKRHQDNNSKRMSPSKNKIVPVAFLN